MPSRILLIEDDAAASAALYQLLTDQGYEVVVAGDGSSAREQVELHAPDLVITDLNLPHASGMDTIRWIRGQAGLLDVPIIIVSGEEDRHERIRGFREGADDFMSKPVEIEELLARVARQLRRHAHEVETVRKSVADELTRVLNRRGIDSFFSREVERCAREGTSLSMLFADLDHFKSVNDTFGHLIGDAVLCAVADALQDTIRTTDRVGRLGGDEFVVIMPQADAAIAEEVAARIKSRLPLQLRASDEQLVSVTCSVGVATRQADESFQDLLARADERMYADKQGRRALIE